MLLVRALHGTRRFPGWWMMAVLSAGLAPSVTQALPGYANLINGFCRAQGAPRVRYTDDGCTLCHHSGTFTAEPAHRVEPAWSEFELGRASGSYSFFCPGPADTSQANTSADISPPMPAPEPVAGAPVSHTEMPWMSLGYPTGHATTEKVDAALKTEPSNATTVPPRDAAKKGVSVVKVASDPGPAANEGSLQLEKLRKDLGISASQQPAWTEVQEAVLAVRAPPEGGGPSKPDATQSLVERLESQQRLHALRIAQLRAVKTAAVRLNASLNDRQQRLLAARLPALLPGL